MYELSHVRYSVIPKQLNKQECIPVGCLPPAAVTSGGWAGGVSTRHPPGIRHPPGTRHPPHGSRPPPEQAPPLEQAPPTLWTESQTPVKI